jgi:Fe2+ or Zn2+ uptake regulation protein
MEPRVQYALTKDGGEHRLLHAWGTGLELPTSGECRYDNRIPSLHPHLVCTVCSIIEDLEIDLRPAAVKMAASRGYADVHERLKYYGICPR